MWLDDGRIADDDAGVTLAFGRTLNANWDAQISLFGSEHDRAGDDTLELQGFGLSLNRVFYREGRVNPFLSFGVAQIKTILKPGADDNDRSPRCMACGLLITLGAERDDGSAMQLRADLGARRALTDDYDYREARRLRRRPRESSIPGAARHAPRARHGRRRRHRRPGQVPRHARRHGGGLERLPAAAG